MQGFSEFARLYGGYDEDDYDDDDYDDDADDSFVELDPAVEHELDRRKKETITTPASPEILEKVRSYFLEEGGDPAFYGGYLDIMERLGAIDLVSAQDPVAKDPKYNTWRFFMTGTQTEQEQIEILNDLKQDHLSRLRLLRYKDFIRLQESVGLGISPDWYDGIDFDEHPLDGFKKDDQDNLGDDDSKLEDEWILTKDEIMALGKWTTDGFYAYANHEAIYVGLAAGQKTIVNVGAGDIRAMQFEFSHQTLFDQVEELQNRYKDLQCPLAPKSQFQPKKKNKKKKKKNGTGDGMGTHAQEIQKRLKSLFQVLLNIISSPTAAIGQYVSAISQMLQAACDADREVAKSVIQDTSVLELRQKALEYAKDADADMKSRPLSAGSVWWNAYNDLTALISISIRALHQIPGGDCEEASEYFTNHVEDAFFTSIESTYAAERYSALRTIGITICSLPIKIFKGIIKDAKKWQLLEDACKINAFENQKEEQKRNYRQQKRQDVYATFAACEAVRFFSRVGQLGMEIDSNAMFTTNVVPGKGSTKVIQKGIVPILLEIAGSDDLAIAVKAMEGLGQLSRVKDCRVLFWQHPNATELVHKCLKSSNMKMVSETLLFVLHLLWDSEHCEKLMNLTNPPLEEVGVRWAAYSMQKIIDKTTEIREQAKIEKQKDAEDSMKEISERARDAITQERHNLKHEERVKKIQNTMKWLEFETDKNRSNEFSTALCRCILVLGTMLTEDPGRLLKVNVLHIVGACIDTPTQDHYQGCATLLTNILAWRGSELIVPDMFPDAEHLVQSLIDRIDWLAQNRIMDNKSAVFMMLASRLRRSKSWKSCFEKVEQMDEMYQFWINGPIGQTSRRMAPDSPNGNIHSREEMQQIRARQEAASAGGPSSFKNAQTINPKCATLTGKLKACNSCGKLEQKVREFKSCARCQSACYCSRACQIQDWKKNHKKVCKLLAAQLAKGN